MNGLPSSLKLNQPTGGGLSYSPRGTSAGQRLSSAWMNILQLIDRQRQQNRQKSILENILKGVGTQPEIGQVGTESLLPPYPIREAPTSLLGKIISPVKGLFDVNQPPAEPIPLEETIAETMLKHRLEPKTAKEKFEERFLAGEQLTDPQLQLIGAYIKPEKLPQNWETVKGDKNYWRINPETGETIETKVPVPVTAKGKEPTTVSGALGLLKTYAGCDDNALQKVGVLGLVKAARNVVKRQPEYAQEIAMDLDDYFDEMIQKYNGNQMKAMDKVRKYMETLGVSQELILPYMRQR